MPTNANVTLDVRNFASAAGSGYNNVAASNGNTYSYRYTGGTDGQGSVYEHDRGTATISVTLSADSRYQVIGVFFTEPEGHPTEFSGTVTSPTTATITDLNDAVGSGRFGVTVRDTTANCTVPCDPIISNEPH